MTRGPHIVRRAGLAGALLATTIATAQSDGLPQPPARRALLIGIDNYALPKLRLKGAVNDVRLVANVLRTRFGFRQDSIRVLRDRQATRAGILAALQRLAAEAGPDDLVWIHYSGHGGRVRDRNGDEPDDGHDETLIPQDGRTADVADIVDDELDAIVRGFRTDRVVMVFDSCHSGTVSRFSPAFVRTRAGGAEVDRREHLYEHSDVLNDPAPVGDRRPLVAFSAAGPDEEALSARIDGVWHGLFTRALVEALSRRTPDVSARTVLLEAAQELRRLTALVNRESTTPSLDAPRERADAPLLAPDEEATTGVADVARLPWLPVVSRDGAWRLAGDGGSTAAVGSHWAIYPPGETEFAPGGAVASGVVTELLADTAVLSPDAPVAGLDGHRAVRVAPPPASRSVRVHVQGSSPRDRAAVLDALRAALPAVEVVAREEAAFVIETPLGRCRLFGNDRGAPMLDGASPEQVARALSRWVVASSLLAIDNPASALGLQVRVAKQATAESEDVGTRGVRVKATGARSARYRFHRDGEPATHENSLQLELSAAQDCHVTVVSVDARGEVWLLFPFRVFDPATRNWSLAGNPEFHPGGAVAAGERVLLPDEVSTDDNRAGFFFPYGAPAGRDTIRVFATRDLHTAELLRAAVQRIHEQQQLGAGRDGVDAGLRGLAELRNRLAGVATRGFGPDDEPAPRRRADPAVEPPSGEHRPPEGAGDWTAVSVNVTVHER